MSLKNALRSLQRQQFFSLSAGVAASNLVGLIAMPFLARLYSAESFGVFAVFYAIAAIVGTFSTLRLDTALPVVEDLKERTSLAQLSFFISVTGATIFLGFWLVVPVERFTHFQQEVVFGVATAAASLLISILLIQTQLSIKAGEMRTISVRYLVEKCVTVGMSFALFRVSERYGLIFAQIAGSFSSMIVLAIGTNASLFRFQAVSFRSARALFSKYRDFPLHNGLGILFQMLTTQVPALFFSIFYPLNMVGFYNLAQRIVDAPNALVVSSLGTVFYRRILTADRPDMRRIFLRTMAWAGSTLLFGMVIFAVFAKPLVEAAFGNEWGPAATFFILLLPSALFRMLFLIGQSCFVVLRRLEFGMNVLMAAFVATLGGLGAGYLFFGTMVSSVAIANLGAGLVFFVGLFLIKRELGRVG